MKPDEDIVGTINTARGPLELIVERVDDGAGMRVWLFSRQTLQAIPDVYNEIDLVTVDGLLPRFLARPRIGGIRVLDWFVLIAGIPLLYRLLGLLGPLFNPLIALCRRLLGRPQGQKPTQVHGSVRLLLLAAMIRWFVLTIDLPLLERQLYAVIRVAFLYLRHGVAASAAQRLRRVVPATADPRVAPGRKHRVAATRAAGR